MSTHAIKSLAISLLIFVCAVPFTVVPVSAEQPEQPGNSVIHDWSTKHVVYPDQLPPGQQDKLGRDPRWVNQWRMRHGHAAFLPNPKKSAPQIVLKRDWAVSLGGTSAGSGIADGVYPAKFTWDLLNPSLTPDCARDYIVFPINSTPTETQANIAAFNWLYSNPANTGYCDTRPSPPAQRPNPLWAYSIGSAGINNSPTLALSGGKVAFVESRTGGPSILHILRPQASQGTVGVPATPDTTITTPGTACPVTGSCDIAIQYSTTTNTRSFPYVDYASDTVWVGDDAGRLCRVRSVFGTPQFVEATDCVVVTAGTMLNPPVYDSNVNKVVVSDGTNVFLITPGAPWTRTSYSPNIGTIIDGAILDVRPDSQKPANSRTISWWYGQNGTLMWLPYTWSPLTLPSSTPVTRTIGTSGGSIIRSGTFNAGVWLPTFGGGGFLFVCGNQGVDGRPTLPRLFRFDIEGNGTLKSNPFKASDNIAAVTGSCSPITTAFVPPFDANATERLFVGFSGTNLMQMWDISGGAFNPSDRPQLTATEPGGTSAIVIDNYLDPSALLTYPEAASIYFGTLGVWSCGGTSSTVCAVKLTQAALQ